MSLLYDTVHCRKIMSSDPSKKFLSSKSALPANKLDSSLRLELAGERKRAAEYCFEGFSPCAKLTMQMEKFPAFL